MSDQLKQALAPFVKARKQYIESGDADDAYSFASWLFFVYWLPSERDQYVSALGAALDDYEG